MNITVSSLDDLYTLIDNQDVVEEVRIRIQTTVLPDANIRGEKEMNNLEMAQFIADVVGKDLKYELVNFHADRPGHDLRYCISGEKLQRLGYTLPLTFENSLRKTIEWTLAHPEWLEW